MTNYTSNRASQSAFRSVPGGVADHTYIKLAPFRPVSSGSVCLPGDTGLSDTPKCCKLVEIDPIAYLRGILMRLLNHPADRIAPPIPRE